MTAEPREELISAYVDGELSPDERAQVEKWLAESAEARQLYEELRTVRASLQSLPRHRLEQDLGPSVLRRAERSVLSGEKRPAVEAAIDDTSAVKPGRTDVVRQWWARGGKRRIIWPAVALAAALLIAMFDTQREPPQREVAQNAPRDMKENKKLADGLAGEAKDQAAPQMSARPSVTPLSATPGEVTTDFDKSHFYSDPKTPGDSYRKAKDDMGLGKMSQPAAVPPPSTVEPSKAAGGVTESPKGNTLGRYAKKSENAGALDEPIDLVVIDVDAEFIKDQQLEKVFKTNNVSFKRLDAEGRQRDVQSRSKAQQSQALGVQELYQCNAAPNSSIRSSAN